ADDRRGAELGPGLAGRPGRVLPPRPGEGHGGHAPEPDLQRGARRLHRLTVSSSGRRMCVGRTKACTTTRPTRNAPAGTSRASAIARLNASAAPGGRLVVVKSSTPPPNATRSVRRAGTG